MRCTLFPSLSKVWRVIIGTGCILGAAAAGVPARALNPMLSLAQYGHSSWRSSDYFFNGHHLHLTQTKDGYLWIGTLNEIRRFDGVRFAQWTPPTGTMPAKEFSQVLGSQDGSLWIGTSAGISRWKDQHLTNYPALQNPINDIIEDGRGSVWVHRFSGSPEYAQICHIVEQNVRCYGKSDQAPATTSIQGFALGADGYLWLGADVALYRWKPGSLETYAVPGLKNNANNAGVKAIVANPDGSVWVGTTVSGPGGGLQLWQNGTFHPLIVGKFDSSTLAVSSLLRDRNGALWIGTSSKGIFRIRGENIEHFDVSNGLTSNIVSHLLQDIEGNVWVSTDKGLDNFHDVRIVTYSSDQFSSSEVDAVTASQDGGLWVGTEGSLSKMNDGIITDVITRPILPGNQVAAVLEDRHNHLWVGVDQRLFLYDKHRFREFIPSDGKPLGMVTGMVEDNTGDLWIKVSGAFRGLIHVRDMKVLERFPWSKAIPVSRSIAVDRMGRGLWLGLMNGDLALLKNGASTIYQYHLGPSHYLSQIVQNDDGSVLGADLLAVVGWRNGHLATLTSKNGLPCDRVFTMTKDSQGSLWLYMACGLVQLPNAEIQKWWQNPNTVLHPKVFSISDGVLAGPSPFQAAANTPDGKLWFSSGWSLQMIDPSRSLIENSVPPPVHIEDVTADGVNYGAGKQLLLPKLTRTLDIRYTGLSLVLPAKVRFKYQLEGQDNSWIDASSRREAIYTNLRSGSCRFHVIASNNDGVWNEQGDSLAFTIPPTFYQTIWFKTLMYLVFVLLLVAAYLFRVRQIAMRIHVAAEARIEERLRISRELHDTLLQGFQGLVLRFQGAAKKVAQTEPAREDMEGILDSADRVLMESRERIRVLRNEQESTEKLVSKLEQVAESCSMLNEAKVTISEVGSTPPLNIQVQGEIERIGTEALINAFRHANAKRIDIEVNFAEDCFTLTIRDDGIGIDDKLLSQGRSGHWGLTGMHERSAKLGGLLKISSRIGNGTEVQLAVPASVAYATGELPTAHLGWARRLISYY